MTIHNKRIRFLLKYTAHLLRYLAKSVHPCTLLAASFSIAETSLLMEPAASVPLLNILNVSVPPRTAVVASSSKFFAKKNLSLKNVHGCTFFNRLFQKANGKYIFNSLLILRSIFTRLMRLPSLCAKFYLKFCTNFFRKRTNTSDR